MSSLLLVWDNTRLIVNVKQKDFSTDSEESLDVFYHCFTNIVHAIAVITHSLVINTRNN